MEERYGHNQVCSVGTYTTLQLKAAIKDISRVYGVEFKEVNTVNKYLDGCKSMEDLFKVACSNNTVKKFVEEYPYIINDVLLVLGQPKAKSIHACATMIFPNNKTMWEYCPMREQDGQIVSEWEGGELENTGFLKEDILGIKQLDKFQNIIDLVKENKGIELDFYKFNFNRNEVYEYFSKGWNGDIFHFGSSGLTGYCKELKPENIDDLIAGISLYRPGAMESNSHNEFILIKDGKRPEKYMEGWENITNNTRSIMCYQEQVMKICQHVAGFDLATTNKVRKALGKKLPEELIKYEEKYIQGGLKNGYDEEELKNQWKYIEKTSSYLFNKSHGACYTATGYKGQEWKIDYPLEYWSTAFQYASEDDYAHYINEINQIGDIKIQPVDVNKSDVGVHTDFENNAIIWPINSVKQVGVIAADQIMKDREETGDYFSLEDFLSRHNFKGSKVNKQVIENLILSGAFDDIENVKHITDRLALIDYYRKERGVKVDPEKDLFILNELELEKDWWWSLQQKRLCGISFFDYRGIINNSDFEKPDNQYIFLDEVDFFDREYADNRQKSYIAGYVTEVDIKESKKIGKFCKITLESNYEFINCMVWNDVFEQDPEFWGGIEKSIMIVSGEVTWDNRSKRPQLSTNSDTELLVLG